MQSQCNSCKTLKKISLFYREVTFPRFRAKLITSLKTDLCQDINLRNIYLMLFPFWLMYKYLNGALWAVIVKNSLIGAKISKSFK